LRPAGILAAPGVGAPHHHAARLAEDHARARRAAQAIAQTAPGSLDPDTVRTNIVVADVSVAGWTPGALVDAALAQGVRLYAIDPTRVRLVWHLDVDDAATDHAIFVLTDLLSHRGS
jgi:threonine aldolase